MIINLKYYLITILSIFLAIGVGIFIGVLLDGQDLISQQQQQLVSQLQEEFKNISIRQENQISNIKSLTEEIRKKDKVIENLYPEVIKNKLKDRNIVILEMNENYSYYSLADLFNRSGANTVTNILIRDKFQLGSEEEANLVAKKLNFIEKDKELVQKELISYLCNALTEANLEKIITLKELELIDYLEYSEIPIDSFVIASGFSSDIKTRLHLIELPIVEYAKNNNIPIVVVEKSTVTHSGIQEYKKERISTVDNSDTLIGKISIIMIISGAEGHFGERDTAEDIMPESFSNK